MANIQKPVKSASDGWWNDDMKDRLVVGAILAPSALALIALYASLVYLYMGSFG